MSSGHTVLRMYEGSDGKLRVQTDLPDDVNELVFICGMLGVWKQHIGQLFIVYGFED